MDRMPSNLTVAAVKSISWLTSVIHSSTNSFPNFHLLLLTVSHENVKKKIEIDVKKERVCEDEVVIKLLLRCGCLFQVQEDSRQQTADSSATEHTNVTKI